MPLRLTELCCIGWETFSLSPSWDNASKRLAVTNFAMASKGSVQVSHAQGRLLLLSSAVACVTVSLHGFCSSAFLKNGGIRVPSPAPKPTVWPVPVEVFSERPMELKVLYEPRYMDLGDSPLNGVKNLGDRTSTRVLLSQMDDWGPQDTNIMEVLSISGGKSNVLEALLQLSSNLTPDSSITIIAPPSFESALRYSKIEKISEIERRTSARIFVRILPGCESKISIRGTPQAINAAADWLLTTCENKMQDVRDELAAMYSPTKSFGTEIYFMLTEEQTKQIIGEGGSTLKRIRHEWMVDVDVDVNKRAVKLSGKVSDVHAAHQYIMEAFVISSK